MGDFFTDNEFAFDEWHTPFKNADISIEEVKYSAGGKLEFVVALSDKEAIRYQVAFDYVSAFRVLDEGGLMEIWEQTSKLGGRPAQTTFKVRNHAWTTESVPSFAQSEGWSYIVASQMECIEIISHTPPTIDCI